MSSGGRRGLYRWVALLLLWIQGNVCVTAQELDWGGSIRGYQFFQLEEALPDEGQFQLMPGFSPRRDTELWILRFTVETSFTQHLKAEVQPLLQFVSPSLTGPSRLATATTRTYLPLDHDFTDSSRVDLAASFDRLNLQFDFESVRVVAGRQAITWGVTYFWPALDLFAPFTPQRVDRDYKPGIDALRVTVPLGAYSELEIIGAVLGPSMVRDGALGAMARIYLGPVDVALMGGKFHQDTVAGGFFTADLAGTGLRGEVNWTQSGDRQDLARDRRTFWRGAVGLDRQLTPSLSLTAEFSWNGYGVSQPSEYLTLSAADRIARGEITALGKSYTGLSAAWQFHPLGTFTTTLLVNWQDPSALWVPSFQWSTGNNSVLLLGTQVGVGKGMGSDGIPGSEYGAIPSTLFAAFQQYF